MRDKTGTVYTDRYDRRVYDLLIGKADTIQDVILKGEQELASFGTLSRDMWALLFKADPILKSAKSVKPAERVNLNLVTKLIETQQYAGLREYTFLDEFATTMALPILAEAALEILMQKQEEMNQLSEKQDSVDQLEQDAQDAGEAADDAQAEADQKAQSATEGKTSQSEANEAQVNADQLSQQASQAQMSFEEAQAQLEQQAQKLEDELNASGFEESLRRAMRNAAKEALEQVQETSELLEAWGVEPGEVQQLDFEEKLALAKKLKSSKRLQEIAKLAGRFRRLAVSKQKEKVTRSAGQVTNIKRGRDMKRLLPSERRKLVHPHQRLDFMRRYATNSLWIYEMEDVDTKGEGPVIFCLDQSGSMSADQETWMKAIALGAFQAAKERGRKFIYIHYGGPSDPLFVVELETGKARYQDLVAIAEYTLGGGTDFEKPLSKAAEFIEAGLPADVVFMTDGHCAVSGTFLAEFNKARRSEPFHVYSVLMTQGSNSKTTLEKFSDEVLNATELTAIEAGEIFARI